MLQECESCNHSNKPGNRKEVDNLISGYTRSNKMAAESISYPESTGFWSAGERL